MPAALTILARAVIRCDDHLIVCRLREQPEILFLPGGHVEDHETIESALMRELSEELPGARFKLKRYLGGIEHHYQTRRGQRERELNHFFEVAASALRPNETPPCGESHVENLWMDLRHLKNSGLKPRSLMRFLDRWVNGDNAAWWASEVE